MTDTHQQPAAPAHGASTPLASVPAGGAEAAEAPAAGPAQLQASAKPSQAPLIHPGKIAIYLMSYRRQPCRPQQDWIDALRAKGYCVRYGSEEYGIDVSRNQNCNRFLAEDVPAGREYILMIDADIVPLPQSLGILHDNGPVVYCGYSGFQATKGHFGPGDFGAGFCRIHRSVLEKVQRPFFRMCHQNDRRTMCECTYFRKNAEAVGIKPKMVGVAGHETTVITIPKSKTEATIVFKNRLPRLRL